MIDYTPGYQYQEVLDDIPFANIRRTRALFIVALLLAIILIAIGFHYLHFLVMLIILVVIFAPLLFIGWLFFIACGANAMFPHSKQDASRFVNNVIGFDLGNQFRLYHTGSHGYYENLIIIDNTNNFEVLKKHLDSMPDVGDPQYEKGRFIRHTYKGIEGNGFYLYERRTDNGAGNIESIEVDYSNQTIKHIFSTE